MRDHNFGRRQFLKIGAGVGTSLAVRGAEPASPAAKRDNPIVQENSKPGTNAWQLRRTEFDDPVTLASYPLNRQLRSSAIEGYVSKTSALPGESVDFMVSMRQPGSCLIDFYRMGYYGAPAAGIWPRWGRSRPRRSQCR